MMQNFHLNANNFHPTTPTTLMCTLVLVLVCFLLFWFRWFTAGAERRNKLVMITTRAQIIAMPLISITMSTIKSKTTQSWMVI